MLQKGHEHDTFTGNLKGIASMEHSPGLTSVPGACFLKLTHLITKASLKQSEHKSIQGHAADDAGGLGLQMGLLFVNKNGCIIS